MWYQFPIVRDGFSVKNKNRTTFNVRFPTIRYGLQKFVRFVEIWLLRIGPDSRRPFPHNAPQQLHFKGDLNCEATNYKTWVKKAEAMADRNMMELYDTEFHQIHQEHSEISTDLTILVEDTEETLCDESRAH